MEHTKELLSIELSQLVPSPRNVRRHSAGQVEELAALIDAQGLLHNLVVTEQMAGRGKSRKMRFEVAAGERRRRALLLLQQQGRLPKSHQVLCELVPVERALEVSLAENSGRVAMHPADEFDAFKTLIDEGKGIEDVAARFGVSGLTVRRRLKLAAVSPKLLALYRQDGINLDQLMALAISDDHGVQERSWFDALPWDRTASALKRKLTAGEVEAASSALVRFVGIDSYEAAGGGVRRDLFDEHQSRFLSDPVLLQRLAIEKLEVQASGVESEGWGWVEARLDVDSHALRQFTPCAWVPREPNALEQEEIADLSQRNAELERQAQALDDAPEWPADEAEVIDLEQQDIAVRRKAIQEGMKTWAPEVRALAGAIVTISREGDAEVIRGLVRAGDRKALAAAQGTVGVSAQRSAESRSHAATSAPAVIEREASGLSESLARRLAAHRTIALQLMLSRNSTVALAALAHVFLHRVFNDEYWRPGMALKVAPQLSASALEASADDLKSALAWQAIDTAKQAWKARLPEQSGAWLRWLIALPQAELIDLLALCTALTANALPNAGAASDADALAEAVGLDMADWWEPTAQGYLNHVSKAQVIAALAEAGHGLAEPGLSAMKKDALVATAAVRLAGKRWLPAALRRVVD